MADFEFVDAAERLEELSNEWLDEKVIAVDTEADSFYHYFDKTCLVQVATPKHAYLIDTLAFEGPDAMEPFGRICASPNVRVLFHAAEYDIYVLKRDYGYTFANVFDTMISAQLLGYRSIGLAAMIEHHFDVKVPKDEQRSDWSRRPLTEKQLNYAVGDVLYLARLAKKLERELKKAGRLEWAQEEFDTLCAREWPDRTFDRRGYLRIKGARKLEPKSLSVLKELFLMRDARAREIDRPPFKVLGNRTLLEVATAKPTRNSQLKSIKGITDLLVRRMGEDILAAVNKGRDVEHPPIPKNLGNGSGRRRMDRKTERRVNDLKVWRTGRAEDLSLDPGVLCPNAALEAIAWCNPETGADLADVTELKPWFKREFGDEVAQTLREAAERAKSHGKSGGGGSGPKKKSGRKSQARKG
ncbi:MAG: HRDC domain-containing protein [Myxococcota bacterium]|nr:HRDC domain-containing protein [Myxococcota bacterium]